MVSQQKLFTNGNLITLDSKNSVANSVLVDNGIITAVGDNLPVNNAKVIDLKGATLIPGFTDAHVHLHNFGRFLEELQLSEISSTDKITGIVQQKSTEIPQGNWIIGRGWDESFWAEQKLPPSELLNNAAPHHPVMLVRVDGHAIWVNQQAKNIAGFTENSILPEGAQIVNDCIFIDNAIKIISDVLPPTTGADIERQIKLAVKTFNQRGLTSIHDVWQDEKIIRIIEELIASKQFPIRCYGMLKYHNHELLNHYFKRGHYSSDYLTIRAVKTFIDGSLGSRSAALLEPYFDNPESKGLVVMPLDEFRELAIRCRDAGFQLNTHAIGDRGNRIVLDIYSEILRGVKDHRWRIEHAQMVHNDDIHKFSDSGIIPSLQPSHCTNDMRWLESCIGSERFHEISRANSFIEAGLKVPGGSDCPIEKGIPLHEFYAVVTRQDINGFPKGGWHPNEKISRLSALKMLTIWAANAAFQEKRRGVIKSGFDADFTVLSQDIIQIPDNQILNTEILMTIVAGEIVYSDSANDTSI